MTAALAEDNTLHDAIASAVDSIAPSWPLDRMIAVNPYWGRIQQPFQEVAAALANMAGSPMTLPLDYYRAVWRKGEISTDDLHKALAETGSQLTVEQVIAGLDQAQAAATPRPLLSDVLDRQRDLQREPAWCDSITHQVSQFCAAYFDRDQADWHPDQTGRLYASWRNTLGSDHSIRLLMRTAGIPARASALAVDPERQIAAALEQLGMPAEQWNSYLQAVLMRVSGWAAWCAYQRWQARLEGSDDHNLVDLLAIRLSWEALLDDGKRGADSSWAAWQADWNPRQPVGDKAMQILHICQRAQEIAYQRQLRDRLLSPPAAEVAVAPAVQAAFCIDVRSEVLRRHLEAQSPDIQTLGFAGFFGLPISYAPLGTAARRPQLPGLLAPALDITDSTGSAAADEKITADRTRNLRGMLGWKTFESVPLSAFTLVEALGLGYLGKLVKRSLPTGAPLSSEDSLGLNASQAKAVRPTLDAAKADGVAGQADIAASILAGMGLGERYARLVLLIGHGSQNRNNPHRAGLDCGACCGQTGEVNARALAGLLNSPAVRRQLRDRHIHIPDSTWFVAGLHNTTTDEVVLFDLDGLPASHAPDLEWINSKLEAAGQGARQERAPALGLDASAAEPGALLRKVRERAEDWAQTRPEWGLANNASFVVARRVRTRCVDLQGRSFLHDYDYRKDADGSLLELIMTAPMIVTNWINMQYFASTVDNKRYGSGNKTLHNVVDGRIGVFEGNGGDLRIGLPWQSLHDGARWLHTPLRLTVVIEAPREAIDRVIAKHATVKQLVENRWLYLARLDTDHMEMYREGTWETWVA
jgi:uncharacterized protein YbcC (UPF0753/DUF2309 family)